MPDKPQPSRIEELLHRLIETNAAAQLSGQNVVGDPDSVTVTGAPQTIIAADGDRLLAIGNLSPTPVFLAFDRMAVAGAGIPLQGNSLEVLPLAAGRFLSAVSMGGNVDLAWQFFSRE